MSLTLTLKDNGGNPVSGEGTSITLNNTIETNFTKFDLYGDTTQQTYSGKNLNVYPYTGGGSGRGITFTANSDGTVVLNGQNDGQGNSVYFFFNNQNNPMTLPAGTYYITPPSNTRVGFVMYDGTNYYGFSANNGYSVTFASSVSIRQFYVQVYHTDVTFSNLKVYPMLTTSAQHTEADYEPYVGGIASPNPDYPQEVKTVTGEQTITVSNGQGESQVYPINLGKNLFDKDNANTIAAYIQWTDPRVLNYSAGNSSVYIPCQPNTTYTISKVADNVFRAGSIEETPTTGITVYNAADNPTGTSITITTSSKAKYLVVFLRNNSSANSLETILASLQIERGSGSTYAPYFTPIELCKIGTYQDYIYKSGDDWYVHKETGKLLADVANGYIGGGDNYTNISYFVFDMSPDAKYYNQYSNNLDYDCTHATPKSHQSGSSWDTTAFIGGISMDAAATRYWLGFKKGTTLAYMKTALSGMLVYYPLATPTDTQITYEPLVAKLEALYNTAHSYSGTTIVTSSSQYLPAIMDVTIGASTNEVTYIETELSNPLTITDIEGKSQNTTLNGNIYVDYVYNKKSFSVSIFNLKSADYATIRGFYDRQFTLNEFPLLSIPELNISEMPVFFEIGSREINSQCIVTDKLTLKFRETAQQ